ncbi:MAG TPA: AI-2E family transporter [Gemmataceae bacterium]|nr:AI-2E family transporter [Gemmataceae bacterium]
MNGAESVSERGPGWPPRPPDAHALTTAAAGLVAAAAGWFLLRELAPLLRPLLLAVLLCYALLPAHNWLRRRLPDAAALAVLAVASAGIVFLGGLLFQRSAVELYDELPALVARGQYLFGEARDFLAGHLPPWLAGFGIELPSAEAAGANKLREGLGALVGHAADVLLEAVVVGFYLVFMLLEAGRFPQRVRAAFAPDRAEQILAVAGRVNAAIAGYFKIKVKASLVLAVPVTLVLAAFGVKFPLFWGALTFFCNFIPYLGSAFACTAPIVLALLQLGLGWQPAVVAGLLIAVHLMSAYLVEPALTGKAVGLSPLVILASLAFWYLCWGLTGMFLAVPLTVVLKIVLENVALARPFARLLGEE